MKYLWAKPSSWSSCNSCCHVLGVQISIKSKNTFRIHESPILPQFTTKMEGNWGRIQKIAKHIKIYPKTCLNITGICQKYHNNIQNDFQTNIQKFWKFRFLMLDFIRNRNEFFEWFWIPNHCRISKKHSNDPKNNYRCSWDIGELSAHQIMTPRPLELLKYIF